MARDGANVVVRLLRTLGARLARWGVWLQATAERSLSAERQAAPLRSDESVIDAKALWLQRVAQIPPGAWQRLGVAPQASSDPIAPELPRREPPQAWIALLASRRSVGTLRAAPPARRLRGLAVEGAEGRTTALPAAERPESPPGHHSAQGLPSWLETRRLKLRQALSWLSGSALRRRSAPPAHWPAREMGPSRHALRAAAPRPAAAKSDAPPAAAMAVAPRKRRHSGHEQTVIASPVTRAPADTALGGLTPAVGSARVLGAPADAAPMVHGRPAHPGDACEAPPQGTIARRDAGAQRGFEGGPLVAIAPSTQLFAATASTRAGQGALQPALTPSAPPRPAQRAPQLSPGAGPGRHATAVQWVYAQTRDAAADCPQWPCAGIDPDANVWPELPPWPVAVTGSAGAVFDTPAAAMRLRRMRAEQAALSDRRA